MSESSGRVTNIKWAINFLLPLSLPLLPESEAFTWNIKVFLAITLWGVMGYALELTDNLVVSLIMMFLYGLSGIAPLQAVLGPWTADPAWMTLGALIIVSVVQKTTILKRMAYYAAIHTNGSYMKLVLAMATLALVARIFLQGTMACIAVIVVAYGICEALQLGRSRASAGLMVATVIFYMDANYFIYSPDFISILYNAAAPVEKIVPSYPAFFKDNAVFLVGNYLVAAAIGRYCRPDSPLSGRENFERELAALGRLSVKEWKIIIVLVALVIFLFTHQYHHISMVYGFIFAPMILYMPGMNVGTQQDLKDVQFSVLFFIIACMGIGSAGSAVGFGHFVSVSIVPMLQNVSQTTFLCATYLAGVLLNFLMTPLAVLASFGLPFAQICRDLNFNLEPMFYIFYQGTAQLWFPYETAVYLVAFSLGLIRVKDFLSIMTIKFVINVVFLATAGMAWWAAMGIL